MGNKHLTQDERAAIKEDLKQKHLLMQELKCLKSKAKELATSISRHYRGKALSKKYKISDQTIWQIERELKKELRKIKN